MPSLQKLQQRCDAFNERYQPGDVIVVRKVMGESEHVARTVSEHGARVLGGHTAVVYVTDGGGCWGLDFVVGLRAVEAVS